MRYRVYVSKGSDARAVPYDTFTTRADAEGMCFLLRRQGRRAIIATYAESGRFHRWIAS